MNFKLNLHPVVKQLIYTILFFVIFMTLIRPARIFIVSEFVVPNIEQLEPTQESISLSDVKKTGFHVQRKPTEAEAGINPSYLSYTYTLLPNVYFLFAGLILLAFFGRVDVVLILFLFQLLMSVLITLSLFMAFWFSDRWLFVMHFLMQYVSNGGSMLAFIWVFKEYSDARKLRLNKSKV